MPAALALQGKAQLTASTRRQYEWIHGDRPFHGRCHSVALMEALMIADVCWNATCSSGHRDGLCIARQTRTALLRRRETRQDTFDDRANQMDRSDMDALGAVQRDGITVVDNQ